MVIKSKIKIPVFIKVILLIAVGAAVCGGLYYLLDTVWNGLLVDWFSKNFIHTYDMWLPEAGKYVIVKELDWYKVKLLLLAVLLLSVTGWLLSVFFISRFWAKQREKKTVGEICVGIKRVLNKEAEETDVFPENYADIAVQIIQMKHTMQHHEQVLREETKQKNDLITYLAHDLKTPLTSVIGYLSLLDEAADMPEPQRMKYVGVTLNKALRLEQLINEFFDIIRYNLQQMVLEKETIDLYYMLAQLTDEFYPILQEHGNQACLQAEEDLTVYGDAQKLARVFQNLLKNGTADNLWDMHPPFQIDGNFGGTAGIIEMLMQSHMGFIHLLPALPDKWASGDVRGLCARGNFEVDIHWERGELVKAVIRSGSGGMCSIRYKDSMVNFDTRAGKSYSLIYANSLFRILGN